jgi:hypothetical protein
MVQWADYFGTIASVISTLCPAEPKTPGALETSIRYGFID